MELHESNRFDRRFESPDKVFQSEKSNRQRIRTLVLFIFLELCFAFLIYRLFSLQCIHGDELKALVDLQYRKKVCLQAKRGSIYDRETQPLAINVKVYSLYADPSIVDSREQVARSLSPILDIPEKDILRKLEYGRRFVWLKRQLPDYIAEKIRSLGFNGLAFEEEEKRFYPKGDLAAHVIGFTGLDNVGLEGIEKEYDFYIRGNPREFVSQRDRKGRALNPHDVGYDEPTRGYDIVLTIDEVIQHIAERELRTACQKWRAKDGSVIVMNPGSGEILALANHPTYDLNRAFSTNNAIRRNRALVDLYEPGSTFKIITAAAAVNENLVAMNEWINCENGLYSFDGGVIHDLGSHGQLTFVEVIEKSSNIGTVKIADRLGSRQLYDYIKAFGFDTKTGVDLPEMDGLVRSLDNWSKRSMYAVPYGQELSVTPLQMLCAVNAIANDGVIMQPFIVRSIMNGKGSVKEYFPQKSRSPVSTRTANIMRRVLIGAVENGTGKTAQVDGYKVAGKTGTSQKASSKGYMPERYISSFVGFLPADKPLISMIVVIDEPQGMHLGGTVACPVFKEIATQVMQYLTVGQGNVGR